VEEFEYGWVFFSTTPGYLQTGDMLDAFVGGAPILVDRRDGTLHETRTGRPVHEYVAELSEGSPCPRPPVKCRQRAEPIRQYMRVCDAAVD